jgi:hypothetical protein
MHDVSVYSTYYSCTSRKTGASSRSADRSAATTRPGGITAECMAPLSAKQLYVLIIRCTLCTIIQVQYHQSGTYTHTHVARRHRLEKQLS